MNEIMDTTDQELETPKKRRSWRDVNPTTAAAAIICLGLVAKAVVYVKSKQDDNE